MYVRRLFSLPFSLFFYFKRIPVLTNEKDAIDNYIIILHRENRERRILHTKTTHKKETGRVPGICIRKPQRVL